MTASVWQQALKILGRRAQSSKRLREKLLAAGASPEEADEAAAKAARLRLINDADYAQMLAAQERRRGRGPLRIRAALAAHGLDSEFIKGEAEEALQQAQETLGKKISKNSNMTPAKAYGFLVRQGFPPSIARQAAKLSMEDGDYNE